MKDRRLIIEGADQVYQMSIFQAKVSNFQTIQIHRQSTIKMYILQYDINNLNSSETVNDQRLILKGADQGYQKSISEEKLVKFQIIKKCQKNTLFQSYIVIIVCHLPQFRKKCER